MLMLRMKFWPFEVFFLLGEACPSQSSSSLAQVTNKIIAEVERHCVLIRQQPPDVLTLKEEKEEQMDITFQFQVKSDVMNELLHNT